VAESADAVDSKSTARKGIPVRPRALAPTLTLFKDLRQNYTGRLHDLLAGAEIHPSVISARSDATDVMAWSLL
jgi:hypothetical protein